MVIITLLSVDGMEKKESELIGMISSNGKILKNKTLEFRSKNISHVNRFYSLVKELYGLEGKVRNRRNETSLLYSPTLAQLLWNKWSISNHKNL